MKRTLPNGSYVELYGNPQARGQHSSSFQPERSSRHADRADEKRFCLQVMQLRRALPRQWRSDQSWCWTKLQE